MSDGAWLPNHPKSGLWYSLKGKMLSPFEAAPIESTSEHGASRANSPSAIGETWADSIVVNTPLTPGGGAMAD